MRKLIITEFISLDGVMEAPGGEAGYAHAGWVGPLFSDELGAYKFEEQNAADILLLGRVTYEGFYGAWPHRDDPMADKINTMTKYVVTSSAVETSDWQDVTVIGDDVVGRVAALKEEGEGGPILVAGSRTLAQALLGAGLVDQINLQVFPVILGSGARFSPESPDKLALELVSSREVPNGVLLQSYRPVTG
jgi:dihydrofolate reductase